MHYTGFEIFLYVCTPFAFYHKLQISSLDINLKLKDDV
jgi:hypothetical protein